MKFVKWKSLVITCIVCLLPILLGLALWDKLPETLAIHFDINGNPDNFASKDFVVFGLPALMAFLQIFCCVINDINAYRHSARVKFERVTKWIVPCMAVILQVIILGYGLGWNLDMRRIVAWLVGGIFLVTGNYLPKLDYIKNKDIDTEKARKINRFIGFETVAMGILFIASTFLPPIAMVVCLILLIPYGILGAVYGIYVSRK